MMSVAEEPLINVNSSSNCLLLTDFGTFHYVYTNTLFSPRPSVAPPSPADELSNTSEECESELDRGSTGCFLCICVNNKYKDVRDDTMEKYFRNVK